jgi:hypothetical protein
MTSAGRAATGGANRRSRSSDNRSVETDNSSRANGSTWVQTLREVPVLSAMTKEAGSKRDALPWKTIDDDLLIDETAERSCTSGSSSSSSGSRTNQSTTEDGESTSA